MLGFLQASLDTWTRDLEFHAVQVRNWGGGSDGLDRVLQKNGINSVCVCVCVMHGHPGKSLCFSSSPKSSEGRIPSIPGHFSLLSLVFFKLNLFLIKGYLLYTIV